MCSADCTAIGASFPGLPILNCSTTDTGSVSGVCASDGSSITLSSYSTLGCQGTPASIATVATNQCTSTAYGSVRYACPSAASNIVAASPGDVVIDIFRSNTSCSSASFSGLFIANTCLAGGSGYFIATCDLSVVSIQSFTPDPPACGALNILGSTTSGSGQCLPAPIAGSLRFSCVGGNNTMSPPPPPSMSSTAPFISSTANVPGPNTGSYTGSVVSYTGNVLVEQFTDPACGGPPTDPLVYTHMCVQTGDSSVYASCSLPDGATVYWTTHTDTRCVSAGTNETHASGSCVNRGATSARYTCQQGAAPASTGGIPAPRYTGNSIVERWGFHPQCGGVRSTPPTLLSRACVVTGNSSLSTFCAENGRVMDVCFAPAWHHMASHSISRLCGCPSFRRMHVPVRDVVCMCMCMCL